ncbi:ankyrin repeat domain-containing protein [Ekhidna sp. To15]|uniref:ankyrin repeat domain-containing protein n=1 Tax=Ekhidna sp. To15 TaxID=3395267 RepID=UPI003F51DFE8
MKTLKMKSFRKSISAYLLVALISLTACDTNGQKSTSEDSAPKMTLHEAAFMGNLDALKAHVTAKSDLDEKDQYGSAPLSIAAVFGKPQVAELLIKAGADLNVKSADGSTPLHSASFFGRTEISKMLLNNGADINIRNNYGSTALETISAPFEDMKPFYDQISKDLGPLGLKLDYDQIEKARPVIAEMIKSSAQ